MFLVGIFSCDAPKLAFWSWCIRNSRKTWSRCAAGIGNVGTIPISEAPCAALSSLGSGGSGTGRVPMTSGGRVSAVPLNEVFCVAVLSLPLGGNGSEIDCAPLTLTSGGGVCAVPLSARSCVTFASLALGGNGSEPSGNRIWWVAERSGGSYRRILVTA
jgi:hypothetical protein